MGTEDGRSGSNEPGAAGTLATASTVTITFFKVDVHDPGDEVLLDWIEILLFFSLLEILSSAFSMYPLYFFTVRSVLSIQHFSGFLVRILSTIIFANVSLNIMCTSLQKSRVFSLIDFAPGRFSTRSHISFNTSADK